MAEQFSGYGMPSVDFGFINQAVNQYDKSRLGAQRERVLSELGKGTLDYAKAAVAVMPTDPELGTSLARLAESRSGRADTLAHQKTMEQLQRDQFNNTKYTQSPEYIKNVAQIRADVEGVPTNFERNPEAATNPQAPAFRAKSGGPADPAYIKQATEAKVGNGLLDQPTLEQMAEQYRAGDTSVLTNLGRGAQGAENIKALRQEIVRQNTGAGVSGADQAMRNAEFFGTKAGQRTVGVKGANIELAATEFKQVLPVVQEASKAVSRTNFPDLNKIIQAYETKTGDPNIVKFGGGINTLVNLYARAISPTGVGTVSDKDHAREILQKSWSTGQFDAAVGMMQQEIDAALASPEKVRDEMRRRFLGGQGGNSSAATAPPAASVIDPKAVQELRARARRDPNAAKQFDAIFGEGEAAKALAGQ